MIIVGIRIKSNYQCADSGSFGWQRYKVECYSEEGTMVAAKVIGES